MAALMFHSSRELLSSPLVIHHPMHLGHSEETKVDAGGFRHPAVGCALSLWSDIFLPSITLESSCCARRPLLRSSRVWSTGGGASPPGREFTEQVCKNPIGGSEFLPLRCSMAASQSMSQERLASHKVCARTTALPTPAMSIGERASPLAGMSSSAQKAFNATQRPRFAKFPHRRLVTALCIRPIPTEGADSSVHASPIARTSPIVTIPRACADRTNVSRHR